MLDEKLYELIEEYDIYDAVPDIKSTITFTKVLNDFLNRISKKNIAIKGAGEYAEHILRMLSPGNFSKIKYVITHDEKEIDGLITIRDSEIHKYQVNAVIISSVKLHTLMKIDLLNHNFQGSIIDIYDVLSRFGMSMPTEAFVPFSSYGEIFCDKKLFLQVKYIDEKEFYCRRLIARYISIRDFVNAKKYIGVYIEKSYSHYEKYQDFLNKLNILLNNINSMIHKRKQKDIMVYWLDELEGKEFNEMQWIKEQRKKALYFKRAYTTMDYTAEVMKSIFMQKNVVRDKLFEIPEIKEENSILLQEFKKNDYNFVYLGCVAKRLSKMYNKYSYFPVLAGYNPSSLYQWYALEELVTSDQACCLLIHCMETHEFFSSGDMDEFYYGYMDKEEKNFIDSANMSRAYLDEQLKFYHQFYSDNTHKTYFSDHGGEWDISEKNINLPFMITGPDIIQQEDHRLFSLKDFVEVFRYILCIDDKRYKAIFSEYVIMDIIDPYTDEYITFISNNKLSGFILNKMESDDLWLKKYLQTSKVITDKEYYIKNILGECGYFLDAEHNVNFIENEKYRERIAFFDNIVGKFHNPFKVEKLIAARRLYRKMGILEDDIEKQCY